MVGENKGRARGEEDCGGAANGLKGEGGMVGVRFGNYVR